MLADLTVKDFLDKVAGNDPVPGGGSIAALGGALASALATMVTGLTIGKKGYEASEEVMQHAQTLTTRFQKEFIALIDKDSEAYDEVFACFKLPKATDEEKAARSAAIQEATRHAALIPMEVARKATRSDARHSRHRPSGESERYYRRLCSHDGGTIRRIGALA